MCKVLFFKSFHHTASLVSYAHRAFLDLKESPEEVTFQCPGQVRSPLCATVHISSWKLNLIFLKSTKDLVKGA